MSADEPPRHHAPAEGSAAARRRDAAAPLLAVAHLYKSFAGVDVVRDVSFTLHAGEIVALIGPNGAGKTTCFNVIHGELPADRGDVRLDGRSLLGLSTHEVARAGVGRTFQISATFPSMTVRESVALALAAARSPRPLLAAGRLADHGAALDARLRELRVDDLADAHCGVLAYGDLKRVEVALALAGMPRLLLMDEPTAGMTMGARQSLMSEVVAFARRGALGVLFTEHDMDVVFGFASRVVVLDQGSVIAEGTPEAVRSNLAVQAAYLGTP